MSRDSFVLYADSLDILDLLSDEQAGQLFRTIRCYVRGEDLPELDQIIKLAFIPIKNHLDRDAEKYERICKKRREVGALGGRPKKPLGSDEKQKVSEGTKRFLEKPKKPLPVPVPDPDPVPVPENEPVPDKYMGDKSPKKRASRFTPPSIEEVREYCLERGNGIDAERFVNFYESKGWMVGKNKMKDWKASVRTWEQKNSDNGPKDIVSQRLEALKNFGGDGSGLFDGS